MTDQQPEPDLSQNLQNHLDDIQQRILDLQKNLTNIKDFLNLPEDEREGHHEEETKNPYLHSLCPALERQHICYKKYIQKTLILICQCLLTNANVSIV